MATNRKVRITLTEPEKAYLAGFFDGEGSVSVFTRKETWYRVTLQIGQVDPRPLIKYKNAYGGTLTQHANNHQFATSKPIWKWVLSGPAATWALEDMIPYLTVKRERAGKALVVRQLTKNGGGRTRYTATERALMDAVVLDFKRG